MYGKVLVKKKEGNKKLALLFEEIGKKVGFVEPGYNELLMDFIDSRRDFIHYLITNVPEEPAKVVLSALDLLSSFESMYFYIIKPRSKYYLVLKQIISAKYLPQILVIDDDYFAGLNPANCLSMNTAWIHLGPVVLTPQHTFHPTLIAESPNELVVYLNNKFPKGKNS